MTLSSHYHIINQRIKSDHFTFKVKNDKSIPTREDCIKNSHLESINYLMFEFMSDRKDKRRGKIFDYVCIPKDVNTKDMGIDFTTWEVEDFIRQIMTLKD